MFLAASLTSRFLLVMKMIDVAFKFENGTVPLKFFLVQNIQQPKKYRALNHGSNNLDVNVCINDTLL